MLKKITTAVAAAGVSGLAIVGGAPASASAATIDDALYPDSGVVYITHEQAVVATAIGAGDATDTALAALNLATGTYPLTTKATLGGAAIFLHDQVVEAAGTPGSVAVARWQQHDNGVVSWTVGVE